MYPRTEVRGIIAPSTPSPFVVKGYAQNSKDKKPGKVLSSRGRDPGEEGVKEQGGRGHQKAQKGEVARAIAQKPRPDACKGRGPEEDGGQGGKEGPRLHPGPLSG